MGAHIEQQCAIGEEPEQHTNACEPPDRWDTANGHRLRVSRSHLLPRFRVATEAHANKHIVHTNVTMVMRCRLPQPGQQHDAESENRYRYPELAVCQDCSEQKLPPQG